MEFKKKQKKNHPVVRDRVSSPDLEGLIRAARAAGALGAKLSGAGWGGVVIALAPAGGQGPIAAALRDAGAARVRVAAVAAHG